MVTGLVSTLQQAAPTGTAGRVFGAFNTTFAAGQAVGMVAGGVLGDRLGVVTVLNAQGCLYLLAAVPGAVSLLAWGAAAPGSGPRRPARPPAGAAAPPPRRA